MEQQEEQVQNNLSHMQICWLAYTFFISVKYLTLRLKQYGLHAIAY